jgi:hypothetical protein
LYVGAGGNKFVSGPGGYSFLKGSSDLTPIESESGFNAELIRSVSAGLWVVTSGGTRYTIEYDGDVTLDGEYPMRVDGGCELDAAGKLLCLRGNGGVNYLYSAGLDDAQVVEIEDIPLPTGTQLVTGP